MLHQSLIRPAHHQRPVARQNGMEAQSLHSERTNSILQLLLAQIALLERVQKHQHARIRPEVETILNSDPWRECVH